MTRDEILTAAAQIFSTKGFHAASMQDIAAAVNLQKASLYHHVNSKQEILVDLLDQALDLLITELESVLQLKISPEEKLRRAMVAYLNILFENRDLAAVLLLEHRSLDVQYHQRHVPRRDRFEGQWRDLIKEGKEQGIFRCVDPGLAVKALLGVMNWTITWYHPEGRYSPTEIAAQMADLFILGLLERSR